MRKGVMVWMAMAVLLTAGAAWGADSNTLTVTASVTGTCKFSAATSTLAFGALDPAVGTDVNAPNTLVNFWCTKGVLTDAISADDGNNFAAGKRGMIDTVSGDVIPYTLNLAKDANANAGPGSPRVLTLSGSVLGTDYTAKAAGNYSDTVTLSINP